jgi:ATP-dependent RNA helicase RhlE
MTACSTSTTHAARTSTAAAGGAVGPEAATFESLDLTPPLLRALAGEGYSTPTPIQRQAIPHVLAGRDVFGCAQTGTGKTAAFAVPLIERMLAQPEARKARHCRTLVLAPTRELAAQIHQSFLAYGRHAGLTAAVIYGGVSQHPQASSLQPGVDVLVATPGRLLDLIGQRLVDIRNVRFLVLDEADRMLDMGFIHDVRRIVAQVPRERQTLFFSATLPAEVRHLADAMLQRPVEVKTAPQATPAETVSQSVCFVPKREKRAVLVQLLRDERMDRVIVFTRTKHGADKLQRELDKAGIDAAALHGNKSQNQRERALKAFKSPRPPVLIATDIAARGIDVDGVSHVFNYELPHEPETYVHRIGRTGRAGQTGEAVSLCDHEERMRLEAIERLLRREIPERPAPAVLAGTSSPARESGRESGRELARESRRESGRPARAAAKAGRSRPNAKPTRARAAAPAAEMSPVNSRRDEAVASPRERPEVVQPAPNKRPRGRYRRAL